MAFRTAKPEYKDLGLTHHDEGPDMTLNDALRCGVSDHNAIESEVSDLTIVSWNLTKQCRFTPGGIVTLPPARVVWSKDGTNNGFGRHEGPELFEIFGNPDPRTKTIHPHIWQQIADPSGIKTAEQLAKFPNRFALEARLCARRAAKLAPGKEMMFCFQEFTLEMKDQFMTHFNAEYARLGGRKKFTAHVDVDGKAVILSGSYVATPIADVNNLLPPSQQNKVQLLALRKSTDAPTSAPTRLVANVHLNFKEGQEAAIQALLEKGATVVGDTNYNNLSTFLTNNQQSSNVENKQEDKPLIVSCVAPANGSVIFIADNAKATNKLSGAKPKAAAIDVIAVSAYPINLTMLPTPKPSIAEKAEAAAMIAQMKVLAEQKAKQEAELAKRKAEIEAIERERNRKADLEIKSFFEKVKKEKDVEEATERKQNRAPVDAKAFSMISQPQPTDEQAEEKKQELSEEAEKFMELKKLLQEGGAGHFEQRGDKVRIFFYSQDTLFDRRQLMQDILNIFFPGGEPIVFRKEYYCLLFPKAPFTTDYIEVNRAQYEALRYIYSQVPYAERSGRLLPDIYGSGEPVRPPIVYVPPPLTEADLMYVQNYDDAPPAYGDGISAAPLPSAPEDSSMVYSHPPAYGASSSSPSAPEYDEEKFHAYGPRPNYEGPDVVDPFLIMFNSLKNAIRAQITVLKARNEKDAIQLECALKNTLACLDESEGQRPGMFALRLTPIEQYLRLAFACKEHTELTDNKKKSNELYMALNVLDAPKIETTSSKVRTLFGSPADPSLPPPPKKKAGPMPAFINPLEVIKQTIRDLERHYVQTQTEFAPVTKARR